MARVLILQMQVVVTVRGAVMHSGIWARWTLWRVNVLASLQIVSSRVVVASILKSYPV